MLFLFRVTSIQQHPKALANPISVSQTLLSMMLVLASLWLESCSQLVVRLGAINSLSLYGSPKLRVIRETLSLLTAFKELIHEEKVM